MTPRDDASSGPDSETVDRLCDRFEASWREGDAPRLEEFLSEVDPAVHSRALRELLLAEWDLCRQANQAIRVDDYLRRLPADDEVIRKTHNEWKREDAEVQITAARTDVGREPGAEQPPLEPGTRFAGYELMEQVGVGGMGVVYRARQLKPQRTVALKMIRSGRFASPADIQRFVVEVESAVHADHDGVVPIYEVGEFEGMPFFSMKFISGDGLDVVLQEQRQDVGELVTLLRHVCVAVAHCHERGVVHRDLKPSNILIDEEGNSHVSDFGLAKFADRDAHLTIDGEVLGTPGYMPPEQAGGLAGQVGPEADVYSLGAILYRMLTGRPPIHAEQVNLAGALQLVREHDVVPPREIDRRVPRDLNTICMKCLQTDPTARYSNAGQLADDLGRYLEGEAIQAQPPSWPRRFSRWARHNPGLAATWIAASVFYLYHVLDYHFLKLNVISRSFHLTCTGVVLAWMFGAWFCQRQLTRTAGKAAYLYLWTTLEVVLVTLLLTAGDGVRSDLTMLYHVLVAGAILRFRVALVAYVTLLVVIGYSTQVVRMVVWHPEQPEPIGKSVFFVIIVLTIGLVQHLALRRSRAAFELVRRRRADTPKARS